MAACGGTDDGDPRNSAAYALLDDGSPCFHQTGRIDKGKMLNRGFCRPFETTPIASLAAGRQGEYQVGRIPGLDEGQLFHDRTRKQQGAGVILLEIDDGPPAGLSVTPFRYQAFFSYP